MKRKPWVRPLRRLTASVVLLAYVASCTHMPSGQKAFDSFDQCIAGIWALQPPAGSRSACSGNRWPKG